MSPRKDSRPAPFPSPEGCEITKPGGVSPRMERAQAKLYVDLRPAAPWFSNFVPRISEFGFHPLVIL